eukprot:403360310
MIDHKTIPFVLVHIESAPQNYDIKLQADQRKLFFKPEIEKQVYEKIRSLFFQRFNQICPIYSSQQLEEKASPSKEFNFSAAGNNPFMKTSKQPKFVQIQERVKVSKGEFKQQLKKIKRKRFKFDKVFNVYVVSNSPVQSDDEDQMRLKELYESDSDPEFSQMAGLDSLKNEQKLNLKGEVKYEIKDMNEYLGGPSSYKRQKKDHYDYFDDDDELAFIPDEKQRHIKNEKYFGIDEEIVIQDDEFIGIDLSDDEILEIVDENLIDRKFKQEKFTYDDDIQDITSMVPVKNEQRLVKNYKEEQEFDQLSQQDTQSDEESVKSFSLSQVYSEINDLQVENYSAYENENNETESDSSGKPGYTMTMTRMSIQNLLDQEELLRERFIAFTSDKTLQFSLEQMVSNAYFDYEDFDKKSNYDKRSFRMRLKPKFQNTNYETRWYYDYLMYGMTNENMKKSFWKKEFLKLRVLGQFNAGFILCTLNDYDLFILDQHACDERLHLEMFTKQLKIESQPRIMPFEFDMDANLYNVVEIYERIFKAFGFQFEKVSWNRKTVQVKVTSMPRSKDQQFEESDFHNLVTSIRNFDSDEKAKMKYQSDPQIFEYLMPRKIQQILALQACRKSVMVGSLDLRSRETYNEIYA